MPAKSAAQPCSLSASTTIDGKLTSASVALDLPTVETSLLANNTTDGEESSPTDAHDLPTIEASRAVRPNSLAASTTSASEKASASVTRIGVSIAQTNTFEADCASRSLSSTTRTVGVGKKLTSCASPTKLLGVMAENLRVRTTISFALSLTSHRISF